MQIASTCIESTAIVQSIRGENFRDSSKICKNREGFSSVAFVAYGYCSTGYSGFILRKKLLIVSETYTRMHTQA